MELLFTTPELRQLDLVGTELLVTSLNVKEKPPCGVAGLVDWRLSARVSRLMKTGYASGALGEVLLTTTRPRLPFDKVLMFGLGDPAQFGQDIYRSLIERILTVLEGLRVRTAVVELPGRHCDAILPEVAADILLECARDRPEHDVWTLVEPLEAQRAITQHLISRDRRAVIRARRLAT